MIDKMRPYFSKIYRILRDSIKAFADNEDYLKASALTLYTLISIVPFLAVAFGIASGFGFENYLETQLKDMFVEQPEVINYAIKFARSALVNAKSNVIAGIGIIALLWTNLSMLGSVENALNDIWKVKEPRTWGKKLTDYLAVMIICPLFFIVSSSLSFYVVTQIAETAKENPIIEFVSPYLLLTLKIVPFLLSAILFIIMYLFLPNAQINARPRILAGIIAGVAFQLWQWIYIKFQVEITSYSAIYGTLAALPLFLIWLQVSWLIVLAGAEMAAHIENEMTFGEHFGDEEAERLCTINQKHLGLLVVERCSQAYFKGEPAQTAINIAKTLNVPLLTTLQILDILVDGDILVEVGIRGSSTLGYQPSRNARLLTIKSVCDAIESSENWEITVENYPALQQIATCLREFDRLTLESKANLTMENLIRRQEHEGGFIEPPQETTTT
jgi:membrane protein